MHEIIGSKKDEIKVVKCNILEIYNALDAIKGTVVVNYKWTPKQVAKLELQSDNYRGLFFIYNQILQEIADTNKKKPES